MKVPEFSDPRLMAAFQEECLPDCDGEPCPEVDTNDACSMIRKAYASVYYEINACLTRICSTDYQNTQAKNEALDCFLEASQRRDELEKQTAIEGLKVETVMKGLRVVNLLFTDNLIKDPAKENHEVGDYFEMVIPMDSSNEDVEKELNAHVPSFLVKPFHLDMSQLETFYYPLELMEELVPRASLPWTVCVVFYGNYPSLCRRFLHRLYRYTDPKCFRLRAGLNAVCKETESLVQQTADTYGNILVEYSEENI